MKLPSTLDVARVAGVSKSTVSRVLNGDPAVKQEARDVVVTVMSQLNYRPNVSARSMGSARSYWVGLLYQNPGIHYIHLMQRGAMARCREDGHMLSVHACDQVGQDLVLRRERHVKRQ